MATTTPDVQGILKKAELLNVSRASSSGGDTS